MTPTIDFEGSYNPRRARRCFSRATGEEFAAKRFSVEQVCSASYMIQNEVFGLIEANANAVQRVPKFVEVTGFDTGEVLLIME